MLKGFEKFKEYFTAHADSFIVIGGTAMQLIEPNTTVHPRVTQDIDMLILVEALSHEFTAAFHSFLKDGGYSCYIAKDDKGGPHPRFYRFLDPSDEAFPVKIELLSAPELPPPEGVRYMALPDEPDRSMSAIVLNPAYYRFAREHHVSVDGIPCLGRDGLIVFKALAYLNLMDEFAETGDPMRRHDAKKHRRDVFLLIGDAAPTERAEIPQEIAERMRRFLELLDSSNADWPAILASLGNPAGNPDDYLLALRRYYSL